MEERYAYVRRGNEATLLRCWGGEILSLPDEIDGLPVTRLADHIFAAEPSREYTGQKILTAESRTLFRSQEQTDGGPASLQECMRPDVYGESAAADRIRELRMPRQLREIGNYAFYGCRSLEKIVFPESLQRLGRGIFTACNHLREIRFVYEGKEPPLLCCLREILGEVEEELLITCGHTAEDPDTDEEGKGDGFRLLFPGYIEESIENTPARIIEVKFEGMGYQYRQCFRNGEVDPARYDSLFYLASVQENVSTAVKLALNRLCVPWRLEKQAGETYRKFLQERAQACADIVLGSPERIRLLEVLRRWDYFDGSLLDYWADECVRRKDPQAVSLLMDVRREKVPVKKKKYEF